MLNRLKNGIDHARDAVRERAARGRAVASARFKISDFVRLGARSEVYRVVDVMVVGGELVYDLRDEAGARIPLAVETILTRVGLPAPR